MTTKRVKNVPSLTTNNAPVTTGDMTGHALDRRRGDDAALAIHDENAILTIYSDVGIIGSGEVLSQIVLDAMQSKGGRDIQASGFVAPLANTMVFGRLTNVRKVPAKGPFAEQTVYDIEGLAIIYNGDAKNYKARKTDPMPPKGCDLRSFMKENFNVVNGVWSASSMAFMSPLENVALGAAVRIIYGAYIPLANGQCRKEGMVHVWEGDAADAALAPLGL